MKNTITNSSLDLVGIGAFSYGINLIGENLYAGIALLVCGLGAVLVKYHYR